jgi:uncharacterized membrane protein YfcA
MTSRLLLILTVAGLTAGLLAGLLGIGGGTVLVPILVAVGYAPIQAVATSSLAIVITSISGSLQNWRMGYLDLRRVLYLGLPALVTAQVGVAIAGWLSPRLLLTAFGLLLLLNVYLVELRKRVMAQQVVTEVQVERDPAVEPASKTAWNPAIASVVTGGTAGLLAGLFGVGGGVIMVPLQILLLEEPIKVAIQTSLGVIMLTAIAATTGHALNGNVLWIPGLILGLGGLVGAQVSTRLLPRLPDRVVSFLFRGLLLLLAVYIFGQAWRSAP